MIRTFGELRLEEMRLYYKLHIWLCAGGMGAPEASDAMDDPDSLVVRVGRAEAERRRMLER